MIQFAEVFPDRSIVVSLIRQLTWTHFIALIPLDEPLQREFYAEMCRVERWTSGSTAMRSASGITTVYLVDARFNEPLCPPISLRTSPPSRHYHYL